MDIEVPFYDFEAFGLGDGILGQDFDTDEKLTHLINKISDNKITIDQLRADLETQINTNSSLLARIKELESREDPNTSPGKRLRFSHDGAGPSNIHNDTVFQGTQDDFDSSLDLDALDNLPSLDDNHEATELLHQMMDTHTLPDYEQQLPAELQEMPAELQQAPAELQQLYADAPDEIWHQQAPAELQQPQGPMPDYDTIPDDPFTDITLRFRPDVDLSLINTRAEILKESYEFSEVVRTRMKHMTKVTKGHTSIATATTFAMKTVLKDAFRGLKPFMQVRANMDALATVVNTIHRAYLQHWKSLGILVCYYTQDQGYHVFHNLRETLAYEMIATMVTYHNGIGIDMSLPIVADPVEQDRQ